MMGVKKLLKRTRVGKKKNTSSPVNGKKIENGQTKKPKQKKTLVIAQEIKFARILASNDKKARAKMLKNLKSWITVRSKSSFVFTETDFMRLWKGLFYCMWMSDKPLIQEELADSISDLIHCFETIESAGLYARCTLKTLTTEWFGIDQYRIDKFQMLVRRILRQIFFMCKKRNWNEEWTKEVGKIVEETLLDPKGSLGFKFHIIEIYMEELAKVSEGEIHEDLVTELLRPFAIYLASMEDERQIRHVMKYIFRYLIFQSDVGIEYMERFEAWRQAGYPTGNIDAMKKVELSDEDPEDNDTDEEIEAENGVAKAMDPRAGRVDVELPQVPFSPHQISELIQQYKFHPSSTTKTRRQINKLIKEFTELSKGEMPLGVKKVELPKKKSAETNSKKAAMKFIEFENELYADSMKRRGKKKKRKDDEVIAEQSKKPKLDEQIDESNLSTEENGKSGKKKLKKLKKLVEDKKETKDVVSPKKKSLQKEFKVKTKTKKLKSIKNALNGELLDGIDDFSEFKKTAVFTKPKKLKSNLNNTWDVSTSDALAPSSPSVTPKKTKKSPKTPATIPRLDKVKVSEKKSPPSENNKVDKMPWLLPVVTKLEDEKNKFKTPTKTQSIKVVTSSGKKRVKIALQKNTAQHTSEYFRQLRLSPQIPYDANKKPSAGVLKPSPLASPVNPFYKKL